MDRLTMKQARNLADMTQEQVAKRLGIHAQTYLKYEKDNPEKMPVDLAMKFCNVVNQDFETIIFLR